MALSKTPVSVLMKYQILMKQGDNFVFFKEPTEQNQL